MLNKIIIITLLFLIILPVSGLSAEIGISLPSNGVIAEPNPEFNVTGDSISVYKYKIDNGTFTTERPVTESIRFGANVLIGGQSFVSGSRELQTYIDSRTSDNISLNFIDTVEIKDVISETQLIYTLNSKMVALDRENILILQGLNSNNIRPSVIRSLPPINSGLIELYLKGATLKQTSSGAASNFDLFIPAAGADISLVPVVNPDCDISINGEIVLSGSSYPLNNVLPGSIISLAVTHLSETYTYQFTVKQRTFQQSAVAAYYFKSFGPPTDYLSLVNEGSSSVDLSFSLNGKLFSSNESIIAAISEMPDEIAGESMPHKLWRYMSDNRYHFYPATWSNWGNAPVLFLNSIGFGFCDNAAAVYRHLAFLMGYNVRVRGIGGGHTVPEVFVNNRWEMYDPDMEVFYLNQDGQVAGVDELAANTALITAPVLYLNRASQTAYSSYLAGLYGSNNISILNSYNELPAAPAVSITLPPSGRFEFPQVFMKTLKATYDTSAPLYKNARLIIPPYWTGIIQSGFLLQSIGNEGQHTLSLITLDSTGAWQDTPKNITFEIDTIAPITSVTKIYSNMLSLALSSNETSVIRYSTDGSEPTVNSAVYSEPVPVTDGMVVKYYATDTAGNTEPVQAYSSPPTAVSVTTNNPLASVVITTQIDFNAAATGLLGDYEYRYSLYNPYSSIWKDVKPFSSVSSWRFDTTGYPPGKYPLLICARNKGSASICEASKSLFIPLVETPLNEVALSSDVLSPASLKTTIEFSAVSSGGLGTHEYYFTYYDPNLHKWFAGQPYSSNSHWTWKTDNLNPGTYTISVWARNTGSAASYEAASSLLYTLSPPVTGITVTPSATATTIGTPITLASTATGGSGVYEYYFTWYNPVSGSWSVGQAYSSASSWTWDTTGLPPGTYTIGVWARNRGSNAQKEAAWQQSFVLSPPVTGITVTPSASATTIGTPITLASTATGGSGVYEYYFTWYNPVSGTWSVGQAYSSASSWTWDTTGLPEGRYTIGVWARNRGSSAPQEASWQQSFVLSPPVTGITVTPSATATTIGTPITLTSTATGGSGVYEYYFTWYNPVSGTWSVGQAYSSASSWSWDTTGLPAGRYTLGVWARNRGSNAQKEAAWQQSFVLSPPVTGITVTPSDTTTTIGTPITLTSAATGGSGVYEYYFTWYNPVSGSWSVGQAYSSASSWTWDTTGLPPGTYTIGVWVRNRGSKAQYEADWRGIFKLAPPAQN